MIPLAEHDEPSLAAQKKQRHVALEKATPTPKNRVWNFFGSPLGRPGVEPDLSAETATGSVQFSYENASGRAYYYTKDHLGSVREMTNSSGTIQARYDYDAFGRVTTITGTVPSDFQYAGYYEHAVSGLNLLVYRAYDPNTERWLSRDPLPWAEITQNINLYNYVDNDPMVLIDPLGLCPCNILTLALAHRDTLGIPTIVGAPAGAGLMLLATKGRASGLSSAVGALAGMALGFAYGSGYLECITNNNPLFDPNHPERLRDELAKELFDKAAEKAILK